MQMPKCALCKKEIASLDKYHCKFCQQDFCSAHRLPESHNCWETRMYREFSDEMRAQDRGIIFGANKEAVMKEFRVWLEEKRKERERNG